MNEQLEQLDKEYVLHTYARNYVNFKKGVNATLYDDENKDYIDFVEGFVSAYPSLFIVLKQDDLPDFLNTMKNYENKVKLKEQIKDYAINRGNPDFWKHFDWFNSEFKKSNPLEYGLFDLNRYFATVINESSE